MNTERRKFLQLLGSAAATALPLSAAQKESAAMKRFRASGLKFERDSEFYTTFERSPAHGLGYEEGIVRRDPTDIIKVDDLYHIWYTRTTASAPAIGPLKATDTIPAFSWDLADVWHATSPDGKTWTEKGEAVHRGPKGRFDTRSVFTPNILVANGRYFLFYQAAGSLDQIGAAGDFDHNVIAMASSDSPDGPWTKAAEPIIKTGPEGAFDHRTVHDPALIVRGGKYFLYYKSARSSGPPMRREPRWGAWIAWGVAIADKPEGPYVKSELNPVIAGGHEVTVWPYRRGVCALLTQGPERKSLQFAEGGLNFEPKAHGLNPPEAPGLFRADNYIDTDTQPGPGITWGLYHTARHPWHYLERFDCDLSLQRGDKIRQQNAELDKWLKEQQR